MTNQEQLKAEIEEILKDFALAVQVLTIDPEADGDVADPTASLLTAFNNHVDRSKPVKKSTDDKDITSWEQGHQNAGFNAGVDEFIANLKGVK